MKIRILLREARERKGLNYSQMAKAIGLSGRAPYFLIETCKREGTIGTWKKIQKVLDIKDSKMWEIMTAFKYIENPKKTNKIE